MPVAEDEPNIPPWADDKTIAKTHKVESKTKTKFDKQKIIDQVLSKLGKPRHYLSTSVTQIEENTFRVNIFTKEDKQFSFINTKISDSFFIKTSPNGEIISSNPNISKRY